MQMTWKLVFLWKRESFSMEWVVFSRWLRPGLRKVLLQYLISVIPRHITNRDYQWTHKVGAGLSVAPQRPSGWPMSPSAVWPLGSATGADLEPSKSLSMSRVAVPCSRCHHFSPGQMVLAVEVGLCCTEPFLWCEVWPTCLLTQLQAQGVTWAQATCSLVVGVCFSDSFTSWHSVTHLLTH